MSTAKKAFIVAALNIMYLQI